MKAVFISCLPLFVAVLRATPLDDPQWQSFKKTHGKVYSGYEEELHRLQIFKENSRLIEEHNTRYSNKKESYRMQLNHFGDLLAELPAEAPAEWNWVEKGAVTPVGNQEDCGSCWAFGAIEALESQYFLKTKKLVQLSKQQLIDCVKMNQGCHGGDMDNTFSYMFHNAIETEKDYPYEAKDGKCRFNSTKTSVKANGYWRFNSMGREEKLKEIVYKYGPITTGLDASSSKFHFYESGVYSDSNCSGEENHAVMIVGYGRTDQGVDFWRVKNSWGTGWGEEGYFRIIRNKPNECAFGTNAWCPSLK